ncbi:MAG: hypothetical protein H0X66_11285 [Verrucomicrobia bacterium]|nr:hypothetical protein [Verrucomicrobiota bacterium]
MNTSVHPTKCQSGIMLIDTLVYIAVFIVVFTLAIFGYNRFEEQSRRLRGVTEDIARTVNAGERWREDIRRASAEIQYNAETGELRIPHNSSYVVYRFSENQIQRKTTAQFVPLLKNVKVSLMEKMPRQHVTSWRWELELKTRGKNARLQPLFQFEAVAPNPL